MRPLKSNSSHCTQGEHLQAPVTLLKPRYRNVSWATVNQLYGALSSMLRAKAHRFAAD